MGFDFDHTLGIDNKLERVAFLRLLDAACEQGTGCSGSLAGEIEAIDELLVQQRNGEFTIEAAVERFMRERAVRDPASWSETYKRMCLEMAGMFVIPQPDTRRTLKELQKRNIPCAILTNGWAPLQQHKAERVGFEGPVLVSSQLGVQKPQAQAFEALAGVLERSPEHIAYVGDSPDSDVAGALRAGMQAVWLDAEGAAYPEGRPRPTAVIHSLTELLSLV